jgi:subtilase family serine protease
MLVGTMAAVWASGCGSSSPAPASPDSASDLGVLWDGVPPIDAIRVGKLPETTTVRILLSLNWKTGLEAAATAINSAITAGTAPSFTSTSTAATTYGALEGDAGAVISYLDTVRTASGGALKPFTAATALYVGVDMTAKEAETLFCVSLNEYQVTRQGRTTLFYGTTETPCVPKPLVGKISGIVGLAQTPGWYSTATPFPSGDRVRTGTPGGCTAGKASNAFTPNQILSAYDVDTLQSTGCGGSGCTGEGINIALIAPNYETSAMTEYQTCFSLDELNITSVSGYTSAVSIESFLDLQVINMVAPKANVYLYQVESPSQTAWVITAVTEAMDLGGAPAHVLNGSFAMCETEIGAATKALFQATAMMATVVGMGTFFSSGDDASIGVCPITEVTDHTVGFPSSSQWVTGVGATNLKLDASNSIIGEGVWNNNVPAPNPGFAQEGSGGGISTVFPRPAYQTAPGITTGKFRLVPDVVAFGARGPAYAIYGPNRDGGAGYLWQPVAGTSASSPFVAALSALFNESAGRFGPLAPYLYAAASAENAQKQSEYDTYFLDVQTGTNELYPKQGETCCNAGTYYDMASGLGSMRTSAMLTYISDVVGTSAD